MTNLPPPPPGAVPPPPNPPPPPPPPAAEDNSPGLPARIWTKYRSWPIWAQIVIGIVVLSMIVGPFLGEDEDMPEEEVAATNDDASDEDEAEDTSTTTEATTTTTEATTTTTTTTAPTTTISPEVERQAAVAAMGLVFEDQRLGLAETLSELIDIETVDRMAFEEETVVIDVTSGWASPDNQHDGAWTIMKGISQFWEPNDGIWYQDTFVPGFRFVNSGRTYLCTGEFMVDMATLSAGREQWETACT